MWDLLVQELSKEEPRNVCVWMDGEDMGEDGTYFTLWNLKHGGVLCQMDPRGTEVQYAVPVDKITQVQFEEEQ